jgi:hypothetical protein
VIQTIALMSCAKVQTIVENAVGAALGWSLEELGSKLAD